MFRFFSLFISVILTIGGLFVDPVDYAPVDAPAAAYADPAVARIGLYYNTTGLAYANLQNETGSGYQFGYFDGGRNFVALGYTSHTKITMLKNRNLYLNTANEFLDDKPDNLKGSVGCYHVQVAKCNTFEEAQSVAANYSGGFPAYFSGSYYVHVGNYFSAKDAENSGVNGTVLTGSERCVTVTESGTTNILFQFDYGATRSLGVMPQSNPGVKAVTWFKGYKYYGGFEYTRNSGANMTVVNVINIDDYVKGVLPYEMSVSWPMEALKAQAICARTYVAYNRNKHSTYGFDLCAGTDCQVYMGNNRADATSDRAVDETSGQYITYQGKVASIFYHSSDGGATEDSENIFSEALPWLRGINDEYEHLVKTGKESWSVEYTSSEITSILQGKGYSISDVVSVTPTYTSMGNMYSLKFTDSRGKNFTFERESARSILNNKAMNKTVNSQRYSLVAKGQAPSSAPANVGGDVYVAGQAEPYSPSEVYVIGSDGSPVRVGSNEVTVITSEGSDTLILGEKSPALPLVSGVTQKGSSYIVQGSGWGHNVGMSQYGAKAMAEAGKTSVEIIRYYFTGVDVIAYN
ncbi:MAG: SpoIID/LytB domain-containing protein [Oscillospiraceae bacterium]|jgi:stage II sporulation protein D|nr:SpoIID/LytB domain-containing protein [Oscillospiraceae bacterium]